MSDVSGVRPDRDVVTRFASRLWEERHPDLKVDRWPEDENPGQSEIEAIAGGFAIEHTSIDTVPNQRRDGDWFMDALSSVERIPVPFRLQVLVPYELVARGTDWALFEADLSDWIRNVAPQLPDGIHEFGLASTPLRFAANKSSNLTPGVFLRRPEPPDDTLAARVGEQIRQKAKKLARYKAQGYTTVLLLEAKDIALMSQYRMLEAAREGMGGAMLAEIDQIWYVEAGGDVAIDLTSAIVSGHDKLG
jgi:hypothetical protein